MRTRIKICGIRDAATARACAHAGVDAVGLVFVPRSPRYVTSDQAWQVIHALPPFVEPVGLFTDAGVAEVRDAARALGLRTVQLHGNERPEDVAALAPLRVIKAVGFDVTDMVERVAPWRDGPPNLAALLFDTPPVGSALPGGSGQPFDWAMLAGLWRDGLLADLPAIILAGGLTPANLAEAVRVASPYGVDVSSGVERQRGVKDEGLIREFCHAVRESERTSAAG